MFKEGRKNTFVIVVGWPTFFHVK